MRRHLLSDEAVELALDKQEALLCSFTTYEQGVKAEIIGPFHHALYGRMATGSNANVAVIRLERQLERCGFIGRLVFDLPDDEAEADNHVWDLQHPDNE